MCRKLLSMFALAVLVASATVGCGGSPCPSTLTILSVTEGDVFVMKAGTNTWVEAEAGMSLEIGDAISTGDSAGAEITFFDGSTMELEAGTQIEILSLDIACDTGVTTITLMQTIGSTISRVTKIVDPASRYEVETPTGVAAVRGSIMQVYVIEDGTTWITNLEGDIWAIGQGVELQVPKGRQCIVRPGQPPELIMVAADVHTVGLKADGTVVAVGWNLYGQCDVGDWRDIIQVATGLGHTMGLRSDGTVVAVGRNDDGQCDVDDWSDIIQVAAGSWYTVGLKADGSLAAVGENTRGQCDVGNWTDIVQVDAGAWHTVGLKSDGTVVAVGSDTHGKCDVGNWTGIVQVAAGYYHTVGLKSDGTVVAVGDNTDGECDVGDWRDIIQVAAGGAHTVGLKADGTVVAVGMDDGRCDVGGWRDIVQVAAGASHTVGLKADGTVVAVGWNDEGQCDVGSWDLK